MSQIRQTYTKFKTIIKKYWYIGIPVHLCTSAGWYGVSYCATKAGVNVERIVPLLEKANVPEKYIEPLKKKSVGNFGNLAVAFAIYKILTPFRYTTTIFATSKTVKILRAKGMIK